MKEEEIQMIVSDLVSKRLIQNIGLNSLGSQSGIDAFKGFETPLGNDFMNFFKSPND